MAFEGERALCDIEHISHTRQSDIVHISQGYTDIGSNIALYTGTLAIYRTE